MTQRNDTRKSLDYNNALVRQFIPVCVHPASDGGSDVEEVRRAVRNFDQKKEAKSRKSEFRHTDPFWQGYTNRDRRHFEIFCATSYLKRGPVISLLITFKVMTFYIKTSIIMTFHIATFSHKLDRLNLDKQSNSKSIFFDEIASTKQAG